MIIRLVNQAFKIKRLREENKRLKEELARKEITIQYLNACVNKANNRYLELIKKQSNLFPNVLEFISSCGGLDFPNSQLDGQMSISDILEN